MASNNYNNSSNQLSECSERLNEEDLIMMQEDVSIIQIKGVNGENSNLENHPIQQTFG